MTKEQKPRFYAIEIEGIWTVYQGDMPIGRAVSKKDADDFVAAFNGLLAADLRDRLLSAVTDATEECFDD
jgi:hypothetical protein